MRDCCEIRADISHDQRRALRVVLWINLAMFSIELVAGLVARSTALLADSVDMLGDAVAYGFSLYAIGRGSVWQARAALLKGTIMAAFGLGVLVEVVVKITQAAVPKAELMAGVGWLALAANGVVMVFLWRRRGDDLNMRSAWLCSRNDVIANGAVLLAAAGVALTETAWPDILIGLLIAGMFATSAVGVIRSARRQLVAAPAQ